MSRLLVLTFFGLFTSLAGISGLGDSSAAGPALFGAFLLCGFLDWRGPDRVVGWFESYS